MDSGFRRNDGLRSLLNLECVCPARPVGMQRGSFRSGALAGWHISQVVFYTVDWRSVAACSSRRLNRRRRRSPASGAGLNSMVTVPNTGAFPSTDSGNVRLLTFLDLPFSLRLIGYPPKVRVSSAGGGPGLSYQCGRREDPVLSPERDFIYAVFKYEIPFRCYPPKGISSMQFSSMKGGLGCLGKVEGARLDGQGRIETPKMRRIGRLGRGGQGGSNRGGGPWRWVAGGPGPCCRPVPGGPAGVACWAGHPACASATG